MDRQPSVLGFVTRAEPPKVSQLVSCICLHSVTAYMMRGFQPRAARAAALALVFVSPFVRPPPVK